MGRRRRPVLIQNVGQSCALSFLYVRVGVPQDEIRFGSISPDSSSALSFALVRIFCCARNEIRLGSHLLS
jgi:hypothetical protein